MVTLRPLSDANGAAVAALRVSRSQERFVSSVTDALAEAAEHPAANPICFGVYDDETPIGFVMIADEVDDPDYIPQYLWKLLVDEAFQGRGLGTAALDLVVEYFRGRPGVTKLTTRARQGDGSPIAFYERYGFVPAGEVTDGEVWLEYTLKDRR